MGRQVDPVEKENSLLLRLCRVSVYGLFTAMTALLAVLCAVGTCVVDATPREITYFLPDSAAGNLLCLLLTAAAALLAQRLPAVGRALERLDADERRFRRVRSALLSAILLAGLVWVFALQSLPGADQLTVQECAARLLSGDFSDFGRTGYLSRYPNQIGLVWVSWLYALVFGTGSYIGLQVLNAFALAGIYRELCLLCEAFSWRRRVQLGVLLSGLLFLPLVGYTAFVYGNLLGLALALTALRLEIAYFHGGTVRQALGAAAAAAGAVLVKMNYLIFWVGILLYSLVEIARQRRRRQLLAPALLLALCLLQGTLPRQVSRRVTGEMLDQGCSPWAWVAMGLQDGPRAPGWYNRYNWNGYDESGFDTQRQAETARADIRRSLGEYWRHKGSAVRFFTQKTASQWCNGDFQGFWIAQIRESAHCPPDWVRELLSVEGQSAADRFLDRMEFVVLGLSLLWALFSWQRREEIACAVPAMIFVGGFLFQLFWEAKGQYTISYYVLLFPYAAAALDELAQRRTLHRSSAPARTRGRWFLRCVLALTLGACVFLYAGRSDYLTGDTAKYEKYLAAQQARAEEKAFPAPERHGEGG